MVSAVGIALIDAVFSFGRFAVAFKLFMPDRLLAQRNGIGFQQRALVIRRHGAFAFMHNQSVDNRIFRQRRFAWRGNDCRGTNRRNKPKHRAATAKSTTVAKPIFNPTFIFQTALQSFERFDKHFRTVRIAFKHIKARTSRAEQHDIARSAWAYAV